MGHLCEVSPVTLIDDRTTRGEREVIRERKRFDFSPFLAVILLAALAITMAGIFPFRQMLAQSRQVENTRLQYETLAAENARLEEEAEVLQTPLEIERIAREQYGLVRPGESALRAVPAEGTVADPQPLVTTAEARPWYQKLWDFLTGRDLVPDHSPDPTLP
jgi:cell division protein FtsB